MSTASVEVQMLDVLEGVTVYSHGGDGAADIVETIREWKDWRGQRRRGRGGASLAQNFLQQAAPPGRPMEAFRGHYYCTPEDAGPSPRQVDVDDDALNGSTFRLKLDRVAKHIDAGPGVCDVVHRVQTAYREGGDSVEEGLLIRTMTLDAQSAALSARVEAHATGLRREADGTAAATAGSRPLGSGSCQLEAQRCVPHTLSAHQLATRVLGGTTVEEFQLERIAQSVLLQSEPGCVVSTEHRAARRGSTPPCSDASPTQRLGATWGSSYRESLLERRSLSPPTLGISSDLCSIRGAEREEPWGGANRVALSPAQMQSRPTLFFPYPRDVQTAASAAWLTDGAGTSSRAAWWSTEAVGPRVAQQVVMHVLSTFRVLSDDYVPKSLFASLEPLFCETDAAWLASTFADVPLHLIGSADGFLMLASQLEVRLSILEMLHSAVDASPKDIDAAASSRHTTPTTPKHPLLDDPGPGPDEPLADMTAHLLRLARQQKQQLELSTRQLVGYGDTSRARRKGTLLQMYATSWRAGLDALRECILASEDGGGFPIEHVHRRLNLLLQSTPNQLAARIVHSFKSPLLPRQPYARGGGDDTADGQMVGLQMLTIVCGKAFDGSSIPEMERYLSEGDRRSRSPTFSANGGSTHPRVLPTKLRTLFYTQFCSLLRSCVLQGADTVLMVTPLFDLAHSPLLQHSKPSALRRVVQDHFDALYDAVDCCCISERLPLRALLLVGGAWTQVARENLERRLQHSQADASSRRASVEPKRPHGVTELDGSRQTSPDSASSTGGQCTVVFVDVPEWAPGAFDDAENGDADDGNATGRSSRTALSVATTRDRWPSDGQGAELVELLHRLLRGNAGKATMHPNSGSVALLVPADTTTLLSRRYSYLWCDGRAAGACSPGSTPRSARPRSVRSTARQGPAAGCAREPAMTNRGERQPLQAPPPSTSLLRFVARHTLAPVLSYSSCGGTPLSFICDAADTTPGSFTEHWMDVQLPPNGYVPLR